MQVEGAYIAETLNLMKYVENKEDPLIQIVRTHQHNTNSAMLQTYNKFKKSFKNETKQIKNIITQNKKRKMGRKKYHGPFLRSLDEKLVDKEQSYLWLKFGDIKRETESTIVAAQDQAISTNCFKRKILERRN
jgi:ribosomal protein S4